jgi:DNA polymerase-3 subunit delta
VELKSLEELQFELNQHRFQPVYLVLGPEEHLVHQAVALLKNRIVPPAMMAFNYTEFRAPETTASEISSAAGTFPAMAPHRMVLVTEIEELAEAEQRPLLKYLERPAEKTVLVLSGYDMDRRTGFYRALRDGTCVIEFPKLKGYALERWTADFIRSRGYRMSSSALRKMVDIAGSDMQSLANEIEKLLLYAGQHKEIPDSAIDELVQGSRQHGIFELTGALGRKETQAALKLLANILETGEHPFVVVTMMARHFRQILIAKELIVRRRSPRDVASAAQVPAFALDDFMRQVRLIEREDAERMYRKLAQVDFRFKSSTIDQRMILEELILSL